MSSPEIIENLQLLANALYCEGHACGISSGHDGDKWFSCWAIAMARVAAGAAYTDNLVIEIFNETYKKGCRKRLAPSQYWSFCGETDMGQTDPALCTECGGKYRLDK